MSIFPQEGRILMIEWRRRCGHSMCRVPEYNRQQTWPSSLPEAASALTTSSESVRQRCTLHVSPTVIPHDQPIVAPPIVAREVMTVTVLLPRTGTAMRHILRRGSRRIQHSRIGLKDSCLACRGVHRRRPCRGKGEGCLYCSTTGMRFHLARGCSE